MIRVGLLNQEQNKIVCNGGNSGGGGLPARTHPLTASIDVRFWRVEKEAKKKGRCPMRATAGVLGIGTDCTGI